MFVGHVSEHRTVVSRKIQTIHVLGPGIENSIAAFKAENFERSINGGLNFSIEPLLVHQEGPTIKNGVEVFDRD